MNRIFSQAGFRAYLVGGAVRDMLRGQPVSDFDLATDALPEQVRGIFHRTIPTGIAHGTVTVLFGGQHIEVTTFRTESDYTDGRHPAQVSYTASLEEDLSRRDFTINAMAASLDTGEVIDPFGGREDLAKKTVRTVGDPFRRFDEDGLRPVRAIRFSATLGFGIEKNTLAAIPKGLEKTRLVSVERFRDEFTKMLAADTPSTALKLLEETGVLALLIPELTACRGITQQDIRGYHRFDVLDHLFFACDGAPREKLTVRLAALFHDVGKPAVRAVSERTGGDGAVQPVITFYNHEKVSAELCAKILTRLRFPNHLADAVSHLVAEHMFFYEPSWTDAAVRRFVRRVTPEALEDIFDLRRADTYGMSGVAPSLQTGPWVANLLDLKERAAIVLSEKAVLDLKSLAVSGNDLVAAGIPAGKVLGAILRELLETVVDDPGENTREHLLGIAKNIYKKYEGSQ